MSHTRPFRSDEPRTAPGWIDKPATLVDVMPSTVTEPLSATIWVAMYGYKNWGANPDHAADINGDDVVDIEDLLILVGAWGDCP